ncbi:hypothetical protein Tco_1213354 [Tanacetum coccineum]
MKSDLSMCLTWSAERCCQQRAIGTRVVTVLRECDCMRSLNLIIETAFHRILGTTTDPSRLSEKPADLRSAYVVSAMAVSFRYKDHMMVPWRYKRPVVTAQGVPERVLSSFVSLPPRSGQTGSTFMKIKFFNISFA